MFIPLQTSCYMLIVISHLHSRWDLPCTWYNPNRELLFCTEDVQLMCIAQRERRGTNMFIETEHKQIILQQPYSNHSADGCIKDYTYKVQRRNGSLLYLQTQRWAKMVIIIPMLIITYFRRSKARGIRVQWGNDQEKGSLPLPRVTS
jgi:hypothetical protein